MGAVSYVVTQVSKMLIIAGLINLSPLWDDVLDVIGMYTFLVHHQKATVASVKILSKEGHQCIVASTNKQPWQTPNTKVVVPYLTNICFIRQAWLLAGASPSRFSRA